MLKLHRLVPRARATSVLWPTSRGHRFQMIEIGLGTLIILAVALTASGLLDGIIPFPIGALFLAVMAAAGAMLILRGAYRIALKRSEAGQAGLRLSRLAWTISSLVMLFGLLTPFLIDPLNLVAAAGFPLGHYLAGQGILIVFAVLIFLFAGWQARIRGTD